MGLWKRFVSSATLSGRWTPPESAHPRDYLRCEWAPPARGYIHPVQDIQAYAEAIRSGITSRKRVAGQLGEDVRRIDLENAEGQQYAESLGLRYATYVGQDADRAFGPPAPSTAASDKLKLAIDDEAKGDVDRYAEEQAT